MKKFSLIALMALSVFLLVGCTASDVLAKFERSASATILVTTELDSSSSLDLDEQQVNALSSVSTYLLSSISLEQTTQDKVLYARNLYSSIALLHANNIIIHEANKQSFSELKLSIQSFRELNAQLTVEDEEFVRNEREAVIESRTAVYETKGDIRLLLLELQGKVNLENIDLVISNFEEIQAILNIRNEHLLLVQEKLATVQMVVNIYLI